VQRSTVMCSAVRYSTVCYTATSLFQELLNLSSFFPPSSAPFFLFLFYLPTRPPIPPSLPASILQLLLPSLHHCPLHSFLHHCPLLSFLQHSSLFSTTRHPSAVRSFNGRSQCHVRAHPRSGWRGSGQWHGVAGKSYSASNFSFSIYSSHMLSFLTFSSQYSTLFYLNYNGVFILCPSHFIPTSSSQACFILSCL
jgi:hypothetical protein